MHDQPTITELTQAVKDFLDTTVCPKLSGHDAFQARIASNVLAIVLRELERRPSAEAGETGRLALLLGENTEAGIERLNQGLADAIKNGKLNVKTPGLLGHLKTTAIEQLKIDQPGYSGLKAARGSSE